MENKTVFDELYRLDVSSRVEKKKAGKTELTYLSWSWAWAEIKKRYENATYIIHKFENNLPYVYDPNTGYMVFTSVTIDGVTHEMWLPVMDGANKAMKAEPYDYQVIKWTNGKRDGFTSKSVETASMFDVNKTIMRCLVKNLAMFGLGLYIYAGEDLPEEPPAKLATEEQKDGVKKLLNRLSDLTGRPFNDVETSAMGFLKISSNSADSIDVDEYAKLIAYLQPTVAKFELQEKERKKREEENKKKMEVKEEKTEQEGLSLEYPEAKK